MAQHPYPDVLPTDVVQKVIGKALQVTAPKATPIKVLAPRVLNNSADPNLELREEILSELMRDIIVFPKNLVQVRLNPLVEPKLHVGEGQPPARQR